MKYDISIISETWGCKHPIFLSGYNFYKINPNKYKKIKSGRSSGGIIVFYRKSLQNNLILIKSTKHYLWMKLNDLFICTIYIPPENSNYFEDDILSNIHNDMLQFQAENSKFVMVGDFNARTSNLPDFNNESGNEFISSQSINSQIQLKEIILMVK